MAYGPYFVRIIPAGHSTSPSNLLRATLLLSLVSCIWSRSFWALPNVCVSPKEILKKDFLAFGDTVENLMKKYQKHFRQNFKIQRVTQSY